MVALTYGNASPAATSASVTETKAPAKGFFARFFEAVMEARMQQAQREIRMYTRVSPLDSDKTAGL